MSGPYPGDMTGADPHFSGRWWCEGAGEGGHWAYDNDIPHPLSHSPICIDCVEQMKDLGLWPLKCETCDGQGEMQSESATRYITCQDCGGSGYTT